MKTWTEILDAVKHVYSEPWSRRDGRKVPGAEDIALGNVGVDIEGAVLYADMRSSTDLVDSYKDSFAAEMYKTFLVTACDVIRNNNGVITSFDGDRVMGIFYGDRKCSDSAKTGLQIHAIMRAVNKQIVESYPSTKFRIDYAVGIDVSNLLAIRTGIRGSNDLAWIGAAANNAAKLSELRSFSDKTFITKRLFQRLNKQSMYGGKNSECMWRGLDVNVMGQQVMGSSWTWTFD